MNKSERFEEHLNHASKVVSTWPTWRQKQLGGQAHEPVNDTQDHQTLSQDQEQTIIDKLRKWQPANGDSSNIAYTRAGLVQGYISAIKDILGPENARMIKKALFCQEKP